MTLRLDIAPGGQKYLSWAKSKLAQMKADMRRAALRAQSKFFFISAGESIWIQSLDLGFTTLDRIRITMEVGGELFQLLRAEDLTGTAAIPAALLDSGTDNYGLLLPERSLLEDNTFDRAKLVNDSFKRQHPTEYSNLDYYIRGFDFSSFVIAAKPGQRFVYLPALAGGTLVVVNPFENFGTAEFDIAEATSILWIQQIARKVRTVEFDATEGLPADEDFVISVAKQPSQEDGSFTNTLLPAVAVGRDGSVTLGVGLADNEFTARVFTPGGGSTTALTITFGAGFFAIGSVARQEDAIYLLAAAGKSGSASSAVLKRKSGDVEETLFTDALAEADSGVSTVLLRANEFGYVALFYTVDISGTGLRTVYFRSAAGLEELYSCDYTAVGGNLLDLTSGDISSLGTAACSHMGPAIDAEDFGHYVVVKIAGQTMYRERISTSGASSESERLERSLSTRWTPDGRYLVVTLAGNSTRIFDADGTLIQSGSGGVGLAAWAARILPGATTTDENGIVTRTYLYRVEGAISTIAPFARERTLTIVETETPEATWGLTVDRPRIWDASVGGGLWDATVRPD